jgi:KUP system potassium uptake protein
MSVAMTGHSAAPATSSTSFWTLTLGSIGVVYGDIGTSPLYALKVSLTAATGQSALLPDAVFGVVSLILWALILIVSIKYVVLVLSADNNGEGGTLSLVTLVQRSMHAGAGRVLFLGMIGASLFYGDAMITPAISVLSAVEGLKLVTPAFDPYVIPLSLVILIGLFGVQKLGTGSVAVAFGPIIALWFVAMAFGGLRHLSDDPGILAALSPIYGIRFLANYGTAGLFALGAVFLAVTGAEALYADMGHFGRKPIRAAWFGLVFPALAINYLGQGAMLLKEPEKLQSPFFLLYPEWALLPMVILATLATIIASQAVISGAFSITQQAMQLGLLPRFRVLRTSETERGQIYIPRINWLLLCAVVLLVALFRSSNSLAAAYGIAVTGDMVVTATLLFIVAWKYWKWSPFVTALVVAPFFAIDFIFLAANALKIPSGGWLPLLVGIGLFTLMLTWRRGSRLLTSKARAGRLSLEDCIRMTERSSTVQRVPGTAVFLTGNAGDVPSALLHNLKHNMVLHQHNYILTVETEDIPRVDGGDRLTIERLSDSFSQISVRFGFMESPNIPQALALAGFDVNKVSFFLSRRALKPAAHSGMPLWQDHFFIALARAASDASDHFCIPESRAIEIGMQIAV